MKVFIAVDGSVGSFEAVDQVGRLLSGDRDEVALYCSPPDVRVRANQPDPKLVARAQAGVAQAIFEEARQRLPDALQSRVHTVVGTHDARHGIALEANAWSADLTVVGARGLTTLKRLLLGSVSRAVVHASTMPVWVARSNADGPRRSLSVLLTCETPELGQAAATLLTRFSWPADANFASLCVMSSIFAGRVPDWLQQQARSPDVEAMVQAWAKEHEDDLRGSQARMADFVGTLTPPLNSCRSLVAEGEPAHEILTTIHKEQIDLVVIGSRHKRTMASVILGSTLEAVLNHAPCSVLVVPHVGA